MPAEASHSEASLFKAPELDECNRYAENVSPLFDPKMVLLRHIFFINEDYTKYVSVGFYPARGYQSLVEFRASRNRPNLLTEQHVPTFAEHLPRLFEAVCREEHYCRVDCALKLVKAGSHRTAKLSLNKQFLICNSVNYGI
jgi:hypothetical protein